MENNFDKKDNMSFTQQAEQLVNDYMQSKLDSKINALNAAIYKHNQDNKNYYSKNNNKNNNKNNKNNNKNNDFGEYQLSNQQANFLNTSRGQMQYSKNNKRISSKTNKVSKVSKSSDMTNLILNICLLCTMSMILVLVYQICF